MSVSADSQLTSSKEPSRLRLSGLSTRSGSLTTSCIAMPLGHA